MVRSADKRSGQSFNGPSLLKFTGLFKVLVLTFLPCKAEFIYVISQYNQFTLINQFIFILAG